MPFEKPRAGTRGARTLPHLVNRLLTPMMVRIHRRSGDRFRGIDLLYLTTVGARSGQHRTNPVSRFDDGQGGWLIVGSSNGSAHNPAWYHNIAANPDKVSVEVAGVKHQVAAEQLIGDERDRAWARIVERAPQFASYTEKTDRELPILRLTPRS